MADAAEARTKIQKDTWRNMAAFSSAGVRHRRARIANPGTFSGRTIGHADDLTTCLRWVDLHRSDITLLRPGDGVPDSLQVLNLRFRPAAFGMNRQAALGMEARYCDGIFEGVPVDDHIQQNPKHTIRNATASGRTNR